MNDNEKEFKCVGKECNLCCTDPLTPMELNLGDMTRIIKFLNTTPANFIDKYVDISPLPHTLYASSESELIGTYTVYTYQLVLISPCKFWDKGCSIYDSRPITCSLFPYEIIKNKKEDTNDVLEEYSQYFDFPCMKASKLSKNQLEFLEKIKYISDTEIPIVVKLLREYNLVVMKNFNDLPEVVSRKEEFEEIHNKIAKYRKEGKKKEFLKMQKLLLKKRDMIIRERIIDDFGFDPKEKLKEMFSEEDLDYLFEPTSNYYLQLLSEYKNLL